MWILSQMPLVMPEKMPTTAIDTIIYLVIALTVALLGFVWSAFSFIRTFMSDSLAAFKVDSEANRAQFKENIKELGQSHNAAVDRLCQTFETTIEHVTKKLEPHGER